MFDPGRFAAGDREYVRHVIREHEPMVLLICQSFARDYDQAQDLAQETWRTVCAKVESFEGKGTFRAWLHRVATNVCISEVRSRKMREERLEQYANEPPSFRAWSQIDPLAETERRELQRAICRALPRLSDGEREAVTLRIFEARSPAEIAEIMGISPATVRSHIRHALNRLRKMMEDPDDELSQFRASP